jgi:hypothetical protein
MADGNVPMDIDSLSDEDFMKLDPSQMQEVNTAEEPVVEEPELEDNDEEFVDPGDQAPDDEGDSPDSETSVADPDSVEESGDLPADPEDEGDEAGSETGKTPAAPKGTDDEEELPHTGDKTPDAGDVKPEKISSKDAIDFFDKVSAPFKADGRDMQVRTPEDVIRLMQMGVNYSRRMQEMKPLRAQDQMLKTNGLNDPAKLNFLIDLSKGNKDAIKKLLKDHSIDPIDIDTSSEDSPYRATDYQGDPKDLAFDDAIKETMAQDGGRDLISDINKDWDNVSKEALRDQPSIFQNILAQKRSGVYSKIKTELEYQRSLNFLNNVPFLQAYHQVGEAMQKAGVFDEVPQAQPKAKALGTGTRKAAPTPKQPTPNVSSATPPRSVPAVAGGQNVEPDYSSMSDEDFKKLAPPG